MNCPTCNGPMWDNREKKKNPKAPDFKCKDKSCDGVIWPPKNQTEFQQAKKAMEAPENAPQSPPQPKNHENGVEETRKHLMQSVNLYNLCVDAVDKCIKPHIENMDAELYQAAIGTLFIEASHKRTDNGVDWYSYVDRMPKTPIK